MMNKADKQALAELNAYLSTRTLDSNRVSDRHYIAAHARTSNQAYRQQHQEACATKRDNTYQALSNARPEVQARIGAKMSKHVKTAEHQAKIDASNRAKPNDPVWQAAHRAGIEKRDRPFHTPYGVFASLSAAARYVMEQGLLVNAVKKFEKWKVTDPTNYYFKQKD
jgi:hypothetical protein